MTDDAAHRRRSADPPCVGKVDFGVQQWTPGFHERWLVAPNGELFKYVKNFPIGAWRASNWDSLGCPAMQGRWHLGSTWRHQREYLETSQYQL